MSALYDRMADALYRFALFRVSNRDIAWDITQECFLKLLEYQTLGKPVHNERALLYAMARNAIIDHWRQRERRQTVDIEKIAFTIADGNDLHEQVVFTNEVALTLNLVRQLPDRQQEIILLRYVNDLPFADIATITGKNIIAVRVEAHRAIKKLKALHAVPHGSR